MSQMHDTRMSLPDLSDNPLDAVEIFLTARDWSFCRPSAEELTVQFHSESVCHDLIFYWDEPQKALQVMCRSDLHIPAERLPLAALNLMRINTKLWMGHFDLDERDGFPCFRHTALIPELDEVGMNHVRELVETAIEETERFRPVFKILSASEETGQDCMLAFLLMDSAGSA